MTRKLKTRRGNTKISIQAKTAERKVAGWPVSDTDERPIKNLNGKPSKEIRDHQPTAFFKDINQYWRRTDTNIDIEFDNLCAATHAHIRRSILSNEEVLVFHDRVPDWVHMAGIEPESRVTKQQFEKLLSSSKPDPILHKFVYLQDVQGLLTNLQRTSAQICQVVGEFYGILNDCEPYVYQRKEKTGLRSSASAETALLHAHLETVFVRMRSLLDYSVKLALEVERVERDYSKMLKLRGASKQYGDKKLLKMDNTKGTLFQKDELICQVSSIRDRIVHDGHLDISARIYESFKRHRLVERFVLIPDMSEGRFEVYKNRTNFYGRDTKINLTLPETFDEFYRRLFKTVGLIHDRYASQKLK
ncbi:hypothetical protein [Aliiroseovarius crassostreae]|uniref:hypothetical protein n=1 Tax=Aliiroseovarius crassostreae TaxID=154981 RepID=UPI00220DB183|nr:hypothetical protein [Aliiroseovarius crassostreae]UWP88433.1 hypothetical protein K3J57_11075 [Aliiroseovarius crassostreae]